MQLPKALWRYALTFLELSVPDVIALAHVSTGWRMWVLSRGMVARCIVDLRRLPAPQDAVFRWLGGVVELGGLHTLNLNLNIPGSGPGRFGDGFSHLTSLCKLHIASAAGISIPTATFARMPLQELTLGKCKLTMGGPQGPHITDAGLQHLPRLKSLGIRGDKRGITDAAFAHLSCLEELDIRGNEDITGAAFVHFTKLHTLSMGACRRESIGDGSFSHLTRLTKLVVGLCEVSDAAFSHLGKLEELSMGDSTPGYGEVTGSCFKYPTSLRHLTCRNVLFSWEVLAPVAGLQSLTFSDPLHVSSWPMPPPSLHGLLKLALPHPAATLLLTDDMLQRLTCLTSLTLEGGGRLSDAAFTGCGKLLELDFGTPRAWSEECSISDSAFAHLTSLTKLELWGTSGPITEAAFRHLSALQALHCDHNPAVTDAWIQQLPCLRELSMRGCEQEAITDAAFRHLSLLEVLDITYCRQPTITDAAFAHLPSLRWLAMGECSQATITPAVAEHLRHVAIVDCMNCSDEVVAALQIGASSHRVPRTSSLKAAMKGFAARLSAVWRSRRQ